MAKCRVIWGDSVETSDYSVFVDAPDGKLLATMHRNRRPHACVALVPSSSLFGASVAKLLLGRHHVRYPDREETSGGRTGSPQPFHLHAVGIMAVQSERLDGPAHTRAVLDAGCELRAGGSGGDLVVPMFAERRMVQRARADRRIDLWFFGGMVEVRHRRGCLHSRHLPVALRLPPARPSANDFARGIYSGGRDSVS